MFSELIHFLLLYISALLGRFLRKIRLLFNVYCLFCVAIYRQATICKQATVRDQSTICERATIIHRANVYANRSTQQVLARIAPQACKPALLFRLAD
ncbi:hypothetical protein HMPREF1573_01250 [Gardnerella vaginalis JCP7276]|nr:hypothetical protein HMPREF1573_01250 [Gardnerella vaginalis JCP7276]